VVLCNLLMDYIQLAGPPPNTCTSHNIIVINILYITLVPLTAAAPGRTTITFYCIALREIRPEAKIHKSPRGCQQGIPRIVAHKNNASKVMPSSTSLRDVSR
jgi:hypothetical protein